MERLSIARLLKKSKADGRSYYEQLDAALIYSTYSGNLVLTGSYQGNNIRYPSEIELDIIVPRISPDSYEYKNIKILLEKYSQDNGAIFIKDIDGELKMKQSPSNYQSPIALDDIKSFGYDLSTQNDLCHTLGREREIRKISRTIFIKNKSIILVGDSGSGKTAIVESIARDIKEKTNPWAKGKVIFSVSTSLLLAGTKYRGEFEEKLNKLINVCSKYKGRIILFIDEMHTLYGLGQAEGATINAMDVFKASLSKGDIVIIGATTKEEYQKYLMNDSAFLDRFDRIEINPPSKELTSQIILSYFATLEEKYNLPLNISDEDKENVSMYLSELSSISHQRVVGDIKSSPIRLAKDIIEDAFCEAIMNNGKKVLLEDIMTSIRECEKLPKTYREEQADQLLDMCKVKEPIQTPRKVLSLVK